MGLLKIICKAPPLLCTAIDGGGYYSNGICSNSNNIIVSLNWLSEDIELFLSFILYLKELENELSNVIYTVIILKKKTARFKRRSNSKTLATWSHISILS